MNQKINKMLNVYEVASILCLVIALYVLSITHNISSVMHYKEFLTILSIVCEVLVVSIELFLFYLANLKNKFYTVGYYLIELFAIVYMNIKIPFIGLLFLLIFCVLKSIYRILCVDSIYVSNRLYNVCKKYGIKIKRQYKKRTALSLASTKSKAKSRMAKNSAEVSESYA